MSVTDIEQTEIELATLRRLHRAQTRLVTAVQELSLARTLPAIQEVVRHAAREMADADGATFVLRDGDKCHYADEDAISPLWKGQRFPMSACISGWAMLHAQPAVIPDIYVDPRIPADAYRPTFVKSLVMVPIRIQAPIGAIGVYWARERQASAEEVGLLQALANTTAVAMENVQVYAELEQRVAGRTQQLEAVNRELEAFSYSVSHDLRAPLRTIRGFLGLFLKEIGEVKGEKARHYLETIDRGADRMSQLIDDLLQLSRVARQEVRRRRVDLTAMVRGILARLETEQTTRQVAIVVAETPPAACDAGLFAVVLENLLSNAWKYTGRTEGAGIEFGSEPTADGATAYFVRDNGVGFDPRHAERLFSPFQRLHAEAEFPGTGVGLAIAQRVVHRHGGHIWATSEVGRGATFFFTCGASLPAANGP